MGPRSYIILRFVLSMIGFVVPFGNPFLFWLLVGLELLHRIS